MVAYTMLDLAIKKASQISFKKGEKRLYSIVTDKKGNIVGESANNYCKSHTIQAYYAKRVKLEDKIFLHAEISALIRAKGKGYKISIARVNSKGIPCNAKPCPICEMALKEHGIKQVEYTL